MDTQPPTHHRLLSQWRIPFIIPLLMIVGCIPFDLLDWRELNDRLHFAQAHRAQGGSAETTPRASGPGIPRYREASTVIRGVAVVMLAYDSVFGLVQRRSQRRRRLPEA